MKIYDLRHPSDPATFRKVLYLALEVCDAFTLTVRHHRLMNEVLNHDMLKELQDHLIYRRVTNRWPGTISGDVTLLKYKLNYQSVAILETYVDHPLRLNKPKWPEDLSFLRENGRTWFVSIAHEECAYFEVENEDDLKFLIERLGAESIEYTMESTHPLEYY